MPIRPEDKDRYPPDWPDISARIRRRADGRCEFCGVENYALGAWIAGRWHEAWPKGNGEHDRPRAGEVFPCHCGESVIWTKVVRVVLTVAHLDHTPEHCEDENLKALCQRCHLVYDAKHHAQTAARTRRRERAVGDLFDAIGGG
jgi:hypothetical protein